MDSSVTNILQDAQLCIHSLTALHALLEQEQALLNDNNLDTLDQLTQEKKQLLCQVETLQPSLLQQLPTGEIRDTLLNKACACKLLNEGNHIMIKSQHQAVQEKINFLFSYDDEELTAYNNTAAQHSVNHGKTKHVIGKA